METVETRLSKRHRLQCQQPNGWWVGVASNKSEARAEDKEDPAVWEITGTKYGFPCLCYNTLQAQGFAVYMKADISQRHAWLGNWGSTANMLLPPRHHLRVLAKPANHRQGRHRVEHALARWRYEHRAYKSTGLWPSTTSARRPPLTTIL